MARENLTNKQRAFVEAYLANGFNATQAAITAGYSVDSARVIGAQNLAKVNIASHVRARISELAMSADEVLLQFERSNEQLNFLLRTECLLRPGPNWLFRIASDGHHPGTARADLRHL